jgi:hypothetical protein
MKVYGPPTSLYVSFQLGDGTEAIGFAQNIWQNNTWQQINFDLSAVAFGAMSVDRVVFFFDQGMVNWDTYYIDDIGLSAAPASVPEDFTDFSLTVFPNPISSESVVSFSLNSRSAVKIELIDLQGRTVSTIVNNILNPNKYSYKINNDISSGIYFIKTAIGGSVITKKFSVNNK